MAEKGSDTDDFYNLGVLKGVHKSDPVDRGFAYNIFASSFLKTLPNPDMGSLSMMMTLRNFL